jgi:oligoribonuclease NrnB/cAMP/cGMP phosphodiesterase (DHH superfamily)
MKVKLFTHTDLDGVGCAVVAKVAFDNVSVEYCDYNQINQKVKYFLASVKANDYDRIFITDISLDEDTAELVDSHPLCKQGKIQLVDHHGTALGLNKYRWCEVRTEESNMYRFLEPLEGANREKVLSSGTSLFYKFLRNKNLPNMERNENLKAFAEVVRRYDCWEWHNVYKNDHPKQLNDLMYLIGRDKFIERFVGNPIPTFTDLELTLLEIEQHRINKYIWYRMREVRNISWLVGGKEYKVAYVFAEQHSSLLGNSIAEEYGDKIDFVAIIDVGNSKVSLRGIHNHIDLGKDVARHYGGGGHPKASGFEISEGLGTLLFMEIINKSEGVNHNG